MVVRGDVSARARVGSFKNDRRRLTAGQRLSPAIRDPQSLLSFIPRTGERRDYALLPYPIPPGPPGKLCQDRLLPRSM